MKLKVIKDFLHVSLFSGCAMVCTTSRVSAQEATVKESEQSIRTYPYADPNPIPVLAINKKVAPFYPYYQFDGYTNKPVMQDWKVIKLENQYITVSVMPELGGKVMGASEKTTNNEFVYFNHVIKFRAIGIRGPWTSGGIEHNFGLDLGHAPWAAGAVDYLIRINEDSSVSCIVGGLDLASRSEWRVDIRLPKDKAYFQTNALWFNPTPLHQAYLSWENAAFKASEDLDFYFPGNYHIGHDGSAAAWPMDKQGRNLASYKENKFGDSKSYHVVGDYRNWFGGYWRNKNFGFGHWAPYADAPGKKLWIWALSREGAIWEDLLTDSDGQYIEAQSGAILNQAAERSGYHSPFTQFSHRPLYAETKKEYWFPVKNTGGMSDANPTGTLNITKSGDNLKIAINATSSIDDSLIVMHRGLQLYAVRLNMLPMDIFEKSILVPGIDLKAVRVSVGNDKLLFSKGGGIVERPIAAAATDTLYTTAQRYFRMGEEQNAMRNYVQALGFYQQCISLEPGHYEALSRIAESCYRTGQYEEGILYARRVLQYDTYHGSANFIYGNLLLKLGKLVEAEEALSIAARTMEYRSASYVYISGIRLVKNDFEQAVDYANRALEYNNNNLLAYGYLAAAYRKQKNFPAAEKVLNDLLRVDPLSHQARFEKYLATPSVASLAAFKDAIRNELPHETYLELAMTYVNCGLKDEAIKVLSEAPAYPMVYYWLAWLQKDTALDESLANLKKADSMSTAFVFPFRQESIKMFEWAQHKMPSWKINYYLALVYWNNLQQQKAKQLFIECGNEPDVAAFYLARAAIFQNDTSQRMVVNDDLKRAVKLEPKEWRGWHATNEFLFDLGKWQEGTIGAAHAYKLFAGNPIIAMDYAKGLLNTQDLKTCLTVLNKMLVLPQEGAQEGHEIYELANLSYALKMAEEKKYQQAIRYLNDARKWPENLGSGMPYNADTRLHDFIAAWCEEKSGNAKKAAEYRTGLLSGALETENWTGSKGSVGNYISLLTLEKAGKKDELTNIMSAWKNEQDSLRNWNIAPGGLMFDWVQAVYKHDDEKKRLFEKQLAEGVALNRFKILKKAIEVCK